LLKSVTILTVCGREVLPQQWTEDNKEAVRTRSRSARAKMLKYADSKPSQKNFMPSFGMGMS